MVGRLALQYFSVRRSPDQLHPGEGGESFGEPANLQGISAASNQHLLVTPE